MCVSATICYITNTAVLLNIGGSKHFYKGPDSKYFWLCWPHMVSVQLFLQLFKNIKIILKWEAVQKQAIGLTWPMSPGLQIP